MSPALAPVARVPFNLRLRESTVLLLRSTETVPLVILADSVVPRPPPIQPDCLRLAVDLVNDISELIVQNSPGTSERARCGLSGQSTRTVEQLRDVVQAAVYGLQRGKAVVSIADALRKNGAVTPEAVGNRETGRVVARADDAETRSYPVDGFLLEVRGYPQILLRL
jgi:hypothetical protein